MLWIILYMVTCYGYVSWFCYSSLRKRIIKAVASESNYYADEHDYRAFLGVFVTSPLSAPIIFVYTLLETLGTMCLAATSEWANATMRDCHTETQPVDEFCTTIREELNINP
jgi:hypothetical protein